MVLQDAIPDAGWLGELYLARLNALMWNGYVCQRHGMATGWIWRPRAPRLRGDRADFGSSLHHGVITMGFLGDDNMRLGVHRREFGCDWLQNTSPYREEMAEPHHRRADGDVLVP